jgi:hypothetical protein
MDRTGNAGQPGLEHRFPSSTQRGMSMRSAKSSSRLGIVLAAVCGCSGSSGGLEPVGGADAPPASIDAATSTDFGTQTGTNTRSSTATNTETRVGPDAPVIEPDVAITPSAGQDGSADLPLVVVGQDAGTPVDGFAGEAGPTGPSPLTRIGDCDYPKCYADLVMACLPAGACVATGVGSSGSMSSAGASCYENGVKSLSVNQSNWTPPSHAYGGTLNEAWKDSSGICYTLDGTYVVTMGGTYTSSTTLTLRNASGEAVATVVRDGTGAEVITCAGTFPVVVPKDCSPMRANADGGASICSPGSCTY